MMIKEAILTLNANVIIACERAGFDSATVKMVEDALDTIEDALKAQEPKSPTIKENSYGWKFYYCPSCGREFYQNNKFSFCEKCGQAVKWDA